MGSLKCNKNISSQLGLEYGHPNIRGMKPIEEFEDIDLRERHRGV